MKGAHDKGRRTEFPRPPGVVVVRIDPVTGLRAYEGQVDALDEVFLPGTEPAEVANPKSVPEPVVGMPEGANSGALPTLPPALP